jgi:hypothetical protein
VSVVVARPAVIGLCYDLSVAVLVPMNLVRLTGLFLQVH